MKLTITSIIISAMFVIPAFLNATTSVQFVEQISVKSEVTFGEVVKFFMFTTRGQFTTFEEGRNYLVQNNIAQGINLKENDKANLGTVSLMAARALNLKDSLLYNIFKNKRYAVRACAAAGLIDDASGIYDKVSGEELIEIMRKIGRAY